MSKVYLAEKTALDAHTGNGNIHVTQDEKAKIGNALTAASVVPATGADLTKLIATIGGKQIFAPEGGGGGGGGGMFLVTGGMGVAGSGYATLTVDSISLSIGMDAILVKKDGAVIERLDAFSSNSYRFYFLPVPADGKVLIGYNADDKTKVERNGIVVQPGECEVSAGDVFLLLGQTCLPYTTPILMADGTTRRICDIRVGDSVMSVNPDTGALEADRVVACDGTADKRHDTKDVWHFDDGSVIETVHRHRVYNVDLGEPMYMEAWNIGERCYREDGSSPRLVSHERMKRLNGGWRHCTLFTEKWNNYFANGILCGNRKSAKLTIGG